MSGIDHLCQVDIEKKIVVAIFESRFDPPKKYPQFVHLRDAIRNCLLGKRDICYGFGWIMESELNRITMEEYVKGKKVRKFLTECRPDLVKEWDKEKNFNIKLSAVTINSPCNVYWNCSINTKHEQFQLPVYLRAREKDLTGCPDCAKENKIILTKEEIKEHEKEHIKNYVQKVNNFIKGDALEIYITKILTDTNLFTDVIRTGHTGDRIDVVVTLKSGIKKSIQCKSLIVVVDRVQILIV